jgi:hypothetical protein
MNAIKATWTNGQIVPAEPVNWPEGSKLLVGPVPASDKIGLDETEWRDDDAALTDWEAWLGTIEPLEFTDQERASMARYQDEFRRFCLEAVRKQMGMGDGA